MKIVPILIKKVQPVRSEVLVDLKNIKSPECSCADLVFSILCHCHKFVPFGNVIVLKDFEIWP